MRGNLAAIAGWAARTPAGNQRRLTVRFWLKPVRIEGNGRVSGLTVERTRLAADGTLTGTGELETIAAQMVLRSVGYQSVPLAGVPFDERTHTVPNEAGRVLGPDVPLGVRAYDGSEAAPPDAIATLFVRRPEALLRFLTAPGGMRFWRVSGTSGQYGRIGFRRTQHAF